MRIHTNELTADQIEAAVAGIGALDERHQPVGIGRLTEHGSRSHKRAFELQLSGTSIQGGAFGHVFFRTATWDEWGVALAALYDLDPEMVCGSVANPTYRDVWDFERTTGWRYSPNRLPLAKPCLRHRWEYHGPRYFTCKRGCGAVKDLTGW